MAQETGAGYVLTGNVGRTGNGRIHLKTRLRKTEPGSLVVERRFEGESLFSAIDRASTQLKKDLDLPDGHLESVTDLPVTEVFTASTTAAKRYAQGRYLWRFTDTTNQGVAREYRRATRADTTFALGHQWEGRALWRLGKREQARRAFESARRHSYRLSESDKYEQKALRLFRLDGRPEAALKVCERWTSLHPYDLDGWGLKARIHRRLLQHEQVLASYRRMLKLAPEYKGVKRAIAAAFLRTGQPEKALRQAESYAEARPEDESGPLLIGVIHWQMGQLKQAESAFRRAGRMDAWDARPYLSALHQARGRFGQALSKIKEEASNERERTQPGVRLSHYHWLRGRISRSRDVLDSLWTAGPERPSGARRHFLAVRACEWYGPPEGGQTTTEFLKRLETVQRETSPSTPGYRISAQAALGRCRTATGKLTEAQQHLETVLISTSVNTCSKKRKGVRPFSE